MSITSLLGYGVVKETRQEVYKQVDKIIGTAASRACLARQVQLIGMLTKLDMLNRLSGSISVEQYLNELDKMRSEFEGI